MSEQGGTQEQKTLDPYAKFDKLVVNPLSQLTIVLSPDHIVQPPIGSYGTETTNELTFIVSLPEPAQQSAKANTEMTDKVVFSPTVPEKLGEHEAIKVTREAISNGTTEIGNRGMQALLRIMSEPPEIQQQIREALDPDDLSLVNGDSSEIIKRINTLMHTINQTNPDLTLPIIQQMMFRMCNASMSSKYR